MLRCEAESSADTVRTIESQRSDNGPLPSAQVIVKMKLEEVLNEPFLSLETVVSSIATSKREIRKMTVSDAETVLNNARLEARRIAEEMTELPVALQVVLDTIDEATKTILRLKVEASTARVSRRRLIHRLAQPNI